MLTAEQALQQQLSELLRDLNTTVRDLPPGDPVREQWLRRKHVLLGQIAVLGRRSPEAPPLSTPGTALIDCDVCAGTGIMTARSADDLAAAPEPVGCPACAGRGASLQRITTVPVAGGAL